MKFKISRSSCTVVLLGLAVILFLKSPAAPGEAQPKCPPVLVKAGKWIEISELERQAQLLLEKKTDFKPGSFVPTAWISAGDPQELVKFHYGSGIGHPFWSVSFGSNATPSFYEHGILGEGGQTATNRPPSPLYEKVLVK